MADIKVLDCTLRDGGRCFGNMWGDNTILDISKGLAKANIDIVELGFIWYLADGICRENISHFRRFEETKEFAVQNQEYSIYIEYTVYAWNKKYIPAADKTGITYIRLGVTKEEIGEASDTIKDIVNKGYKLFVQGINIFSYTREELREFIKIVNSVNPYAFAVVDTFGHMDVEEIKALYLYIDQYLNPNISIALHSHNNKGLSLELVKALINMIDGKRSIIIDGTLDGIGMGAGNQKTEAVCAFLNEKYRGSYDISMLNQLIDNNIVKYRKKFFWGECDLAACGGDNFRPPMMISYINTEYGYLSDEQKRMLLLMCPVRHGVSPECVDKNVALLNGETREEDSFLVLSEKLKKQNVNIIAKGPSITERVDDIKKCIQRNKGITILINPDVNSEYIENNKNIYFFCTNEHAVNKLIRHIDSEQMITFQGIPCATKQGCDIFRINLMNLYTESELIFNDGVMWILNWLYKISFSNHINIAGFDGYDEAGITSGTKMRMFGKALCLLEKNLSISFITHSSYEDYMCINT